jgi:hypothetical protein
MTPREHDIKLADLYNELYKTTDHLARVEISLLQYAKAKFYYRGRKRVTDMKLDEALEILGLELQKLNAHRLATKSEDRPYGDWSTYEYGGLAPHEQKGAESSLASHYETLDHLGEINRQIDELEANYTGWSRFFLVTSSKGHIHSSMDCSTCRHTTRYGWLPELSGKTEAEAVESQGPALCSVCFPSAPVEWTAEKITAAKATKLAH